MAGGVKSSLQGFLHFTGQIPGSLPLISDKAVCVGDFLERGDIVVTGFYSRLE